MYKIPSPLPHNVTQFWELHTFIFAIFLGLEAIIGPANTQG